MPEIQGDTQFEAGPQVILNIAGTPYQVAEINTEVEVDVELIYENSAKAVGWAFNQINFSGSLSFSGDRAGEITPKLTRSGEAEWAPKEGVSLVITHGRGRPEVYKNIFMTNQSYTMSSGEVSSTDYEFIAMDGELGQDR